jgi:hypothetical protein
VISVHEIAFTHYFSLEVQANLPEVRIWYIHKTSHPMRKRAATTMLAAIIDIDKKLLFARPHVLSAAPVIMPIFSTTKNGGSK